MRKALEMYLYKSSAFLDIYKFTKVKNSELLSKFLNDKKLTFRCKFDQLATLRHVEIYSGSLALIFYLKFPFVTHLFFYF